MISDRVYISPETPDKKRPQESVEKNTDLIWKAVAELENGGTPNTLENVSAWMRANGDSKMTASGLWAFLMRNPGLKETLGIMTEHEYTLYRYTTAADELTAKHGKVTINLLSEHLGIRRDTVKT